MSDSQRRGKIARLPRDIRDQLNLRLDDGLEAAEILPWLNALPEVRQVLARFFRGSPVTSQNLSAWRSGGFQEWLFHQRFLDTAIHMRQYVDELEDALNINSLGARRTLADCMITQLSIRFAAFFARWDGVALSPETGALLKIGNFIIKLQRAACQAERQALELPRLRREAELEDLKEREINEAFIRHCEENVREDGTVPSLSEIERSRRPAQPKPPRNKPQSRSIKPAKASPPSKSTRPKPTKPSAVQHLHDSRLSSLSSDPSSEALAKEEASAKEAPTG